MRTCQPKDSKRREWRSAGEGGREKERMHAGEKEREKERVCMCMGEGPLALWLLFLCVPLGLPYFNLG